VSGIAGDREIQCTLGWGIVAREAQGMRRRCEWAGTELSIAYHDTEWGVPLHDDRGLFEFLILEGAQAGLSWETILKKRANYDKAFRGFDPAKVARFGAEDVERLLGPDGFARLKDRAGAREVLERAIRDFAGDGTG